MNTHTGRVWRVDAADCHELDGYDSGCVVAQFSGSFSTAWKNVWSLSDLTCTNKDDLDRYIEPVTTASNVIVYANGTEDTGVTRALRIMRDCYIVLSIGYFAQTTGQRTHTHVMLYQDDSSTAADNIVHLWECKRTESNNARATSLTAGIWAQRGNVLAAVSSNDSGSAMSIHACVVVRDIDQMQQQTGTPLVV